MEKEPREITLPFNALGITLFLTVLSLAAIIPFVVVLWLVMLVAPWWAAIPIAMLSSAALLIKVVTVNKNK